MGGSNETLGTGENPSPLIERLARRLRDVRDAKGMSRRVLSEESGISQRYLAQLEAGKGNISVSLLERVAQALGVPMHALIVPNLSLDREAQEIAALYETAPLDTRQKIKKLLNAPAGTDRRRNRICLIGLQGAGKSTLGRQAAQALGLSFVALDTLIEEETKLPSGKIHTLYGEDGYLRLEADAVERVIARPAQMILAASSGIIDNEPAFARLKQHFHTIWIHTSAGEHSVRLNAPSYKGAGRGAEKLSTSEMKAMLEARTPLFSQADARLDTSDRTAASSLNDLIALMASRGFLGKT